MVARLDFWSVSLAQNPKSAECGVSRERCVFAERGHHVKEAY